MIYEFTPRGTCSRKMIVEYEGDKIISLKVIGGCSGNLQGIAALVKGMSFSEVISRLEGIKCGYKDTSCPDQLARGLKEMEK